MEGQAATSNMVRKRGEMDRSCHSYHISKRAHRAPIANIRIKEGFDVHDIACMVNVTHANVKDLQITLSTHTLGQKSRKITLKQYGETSGGGDGGKNFTNSIWADVGDALVEEEDQAPFTGVWLPSEPFHELERGGGKRTHRGGSKGVWTLEVDARHTNASEDLPVLEGWTLYLCAQNQSLLATPEISNIYERSHLDQGAVAVEAFSGDGQGAGYGYAQLAARYPAMMQTSPWRRMPVLPRMFEVSRRIYRTAVGWVVGLYVWDLAKSLVHHHLQGGPTPRSKFDFASHMANYKKSIIGHFDAVAN
jgi:hypothetical protein